ncbi:phenylacetate--CoA ligase family protein [Algoriphagus hitonicola]|uniref:hypothetical protein n=1 Tax=Algoriphagus hitonicola TaxID=435880 RepID=UPI003623B93F
MQEEKLRSLLSFAFKHSPYYRELLQNAGYDNLHEFKVKDLQYIPITFKHHLIDQNSKVQVERSLFKKTFLCETSGSSGQILTFYRDENWDSFNRAVQLRSYSWHDVQPWEPNLYFWGYNKSALKKRKIRFLDTLVNRKRIFDYDELVREKIYGKLDKFSFIEGYSSMLYEFALLLEKQGETYTHLKMVKGTSEMIYPHYQEVANKVFGKKIISEYGAAESGLIAFECPHGNMHINMEGVILESDPNEGILVTNLSSYSFPVIRYSLGDFVKLKSEDFECPCGMKHPIVEEISGRIGHNLLSEKKRYPSFILYYVFKNLFFNEGLKIDYQAHQYKIGEMEIWFKKPLEPKVEELITNEFAKYCPDIKLRLVINDNFRSVRGKLKDFINHLNEEQHEQEVS